MHILKSNYNTFTDIYIGYVPETPFIMCHGVRVKLQYTQFLPHIFLAQLNLSRSKTSVKGQKVDQWLPGGRGGSVD